jgi:hypothetical protein
MYSERSVYQRFCFHIKLSGKLIKTGHIFEKTLIFTLGWNSSPALGGLTMNPPDTSPSQGLQRIIKQNTPKSKQITGIQ